jgi:cytochrome c-type biogenesis protein CcmF
MQLFRVPLAVSLRRLAGLPRSSFGMTAAHLGIGLTVLGVVASTTWQTETIVDMQPGQSVVVGSRTVTLEGYEGEDAGNYVATRLRFTVHNAAGEEIAVMEPEKRGYLVRQTPTTEAAIISVGLLSHLYISPGDMREGATILDPGQFTPQSITTVRVYWKPLVALIWIGAIVMALGGILSLSDRRLRVGAPKRSGRAAIAPQPAE